MKLKTKRKREYEDDGLLPLVNIIFLLTYFFYDCWCHRKKYYKR